ncbi:hypothetical protein FXO37_09304 [Capsicum annuum]|nr:hypothetical protein FXO37_09304 [Capsicum annuum]
MKIKSDDYDLFIIGQYPNSFSSNGLVNYGEWIINDDESLTEFLTLPSDYASQIKLNILQVYVKKERTSRHAHSPAQTNVYTQLENPTNIDDARLSQYSNFFDMNVSQYFMSSNVPTQISVPDLNEILNQSDWGLTLGETNNDDFLEQDYNYGQSSQLGWVDNAGTSSNIPLLLNLDVAEYYRDNVSRDEHVIPENIENGDQANYGELSQSDDSASNNADGGECPYDSSSSDDGVRFNSRQRSMSISPYPKQESIPQTSMQRPTSMSQSNNRPRFYSNEVLFLDHFQEAPDVFMDKHENNFVPTYQGCSFKLCATKDSSNNLWKIDKYIGEHTCNMGHCRGGHNNLDVDMIATVLVPYIEKTPRYPIKDCQISVLNKFRKIISRRKAFLGRKHAFEQVYGNWEASFCELPRFIAAMKHFKPGTDGNGSIFSLAFAITANKSFDTWTKFLSDLHQHVVCSRQGITLIADRHHGILESVSAERN